MVFMLKKKTALPTQAEALPGRSQSMPIPAGHFVNHRPLRGPFPAGLEQAISAWAASGVPNGCFGRSQAYSRPLSAMPGA